MQDRPLKNWFRWALGGDLLAAALATGLAQFVRFGTDLTAGPSVSYPLLGGFVLVAWPALLALSNAYDLRASLFGVEEVRRVMRAGVLLLAVLGTANLFFRLDLSRGYMAALLPGAVILTTAWRVNLRSGDRRRATRGWGHHQALAVGPVADILELCRRLEDSERADLEVVAFVADDLGPDDDVPPPLEDVCRLASRGVISGEHLAALHVEVDLLVRVGQPQPDEMGSLARRAHDLGVPVAVAPSRQDSNAHLAMSYIPLGDTPLLVVETPAFSVTGVFIKGVFDRVMSLLVLLAVTPLLVVIGAVIALRDGRPVLFRQERVGHNGLPFQCLKFRTMCPDAEERLADLLDLNEASGPIFKLRDDPRVTRTGRWLRRHSLDELPQLVNVLKGEMSIVGPRPPLPQEVAVYDEQAARRLFVKPGMTGLWQTQGRSDLPWDDGIYLDLLYVDHWSPLLDLVIIARTVRSIVRPSGAY